MTINVSHQAMQTARGDVVEAARRLAAGRATADRRMRSLLSGGWTGVAADSVHEAWEDWLTAADQVKEGLDAMEALIAAFHRDLVQQDDRSQQALDHISQRIIDRLG